MVCYAPVLFVKVTVYFNVYGKGTLLYERLSMFLHRQDTIHIQLFEISVQVLKVRDQVVSLPVGLFHDCKQDVERLVIKLQHSNVQIYNMVFMVELCR